MASSQQSLSPAEWSLLRALILEHPAPTGYPPAAPVAEHLGISPYEARGHLEMLERFRMIRLVTRTAGMHFEVLWRGREEASKRGESIPSPCDDARDLIAFLRDPVDGARAGAHQVNDSDIVRRFGWNEARALDAARVLSDHGHVKLHTPIGGSFFVFLTASGRRNA
jgi:hypothetical protein